MSARGGSWYWRAGGRLQVINELKGKAHGTLDGSNCQMLPETAEGDTANTTPTLVSVVQMISCNCLQSCRSLSLQLDDKSTLFSQHPCTQHSQAADPGKTRTAAHSLRFLRTLAGSRMASKKGCFSSCRASGRVCGSWRMHSSTNSRSSWSWIFSMPWGGMPCSEQVRS